MVKVFFKKMAKTICPVLFFGPDVSFSQFLEKFLIHFAFIFQWLGLAWLGLAWLGLSKKVSNFCRTLPITMAEAEKQQFQKEEFMRKANQNMTKGFRTAADIAQRLISSVTTPITKTLAAATDTAEAIRHEASSYLKRGECAKAWQKLLSPSESGFNMFSYARAWTVTGGCINKFCAFYENGFKGKIMGNPPNQVTLRFDLGDVWDGLDWTAHIEDVTFEEGAVKAFFNWGFTNRSEMSETVGFRPKWPNGGVGPRGYYEEAVDEKVAAEIIDKCGATL